MHTLKATALKKHYGKRTVVNSVSVLINSAEVVGLLGPNGAGKTTTFYMIVGAVKPDEGLIEIDSEDITHYPMYKRASLGIGYLPQEPSIFRKLTVRDNIKAVLEIKGVPDDSIEQKTEEILHDFQLVAFADREGARLSGGERRRTEIARAVALEPLFLLFDEPFAGIDPIAIIELKKIIMQLKQKGIGILITDHNVRDTLSITDRAYIISSGNVIAEGCPSDLVQNTLVVDAYLGREFTL